MKILIIFLISCSFLLQGQEKYVAKDYSYLLGMEGFNDQLLQGHFKLYNNYVANVNKIIEILDDYASGNKKFDFTYGALKMRFNWELDGLLLHELYFDNLGGKGSLNSKSPIYQKIVADFGSFEAWKNDFIATGSIRGIGYSILYYDPNGHRLFNIWVNEHDAGHLAGAVPLLVMDVFEHAYMPQYGLDKAKYIEAFFQNINWDVVEQRALGKVSATKQKQPR